MWHILGWIALGAVVGVGGVYVAFISQKTYF